MRNPGNLLVIIGCAVLLGLFLIVVLAITRVKQTDQWTNYVHGISNLSSPRTTDLNGDGIMDIVVGAGSGEVMGSDSAVLALDGQSGNLMWAASAPYQMITSPLFQDINSDNTSDVFIGGRSGSFMALDGKSGRTLWEVSENPHKTSKKDSLGNFYTPQWIDDINGDGFRDLFIANGGDIRIPDNVKNRPPGRLMVISGKNGTILAMDTMPDGKETYMSALCADFNGDGEKSIVFGSGGEFIQGNLYLGKLKDLLQNDLSRATILADGGKSGFIAPPVLADITRDGVLDIVANAVDGRMLAFDGETGTKLWQAQIPGTVIYSSIAVGNFTGDEGPDFFTNMGKNLWPNIQQTIQVMVEGNTGNIVYKDSLGYFQINSPLAADLNGDGVDEVLFNANRMRGNVKGNPLANMHRIINRNLIIDFNNDRVFHLGRVNHGVNPGATPWIGDLDHDDFPDVIYTNFADTVRFRPFNGMEIHRFESNQYSNVSVPWGSYMGTHYDGIFNSDQFDF